MLPDFASMSRARLARVEHPEVALGVHLHRATDAVFHDCPAFRDLLLGGIERLRAAGLGRGPARGAAHLAIELLLDGALVSDPEIGRLYLAGVGASARNDVERGIGWSDAGGAGRWRLLRRRLLDRGVPHVYADGSWVAETTVRVLAARPRLALAARDEPAVAAWVTSTQPEVIAAVPDLLSQVRAGLAQRPARP
jgi:hypothetical protein